MPASTRVSALFALLFLSTSSQAMAATNPQAVKCTAAAPCQLDGNSEKKIWQEAPIFDTFSEYSPRNGNPTNYKTTYQTAYDANAIYFLIRALDPHPEEIRAPLSRHDAITTDQDYVSVLIDPIGSKKSAQFFRVTPVGGTAEGTYTAETDNLDLAPDFDWDAVSKPVAGGYVTEIRIPFASLRYSSTPLASWRIMVARVIPRGQRTVVLSVSLPNDAPNFISALQPLDGIAQPDAPRFLQIRPTTTLRRTDETIDGQRRRATEASLGVDIKARPFANVIVDATINPDFSQVEIDEPQLNRNVQFALSTLEKRPFFLESSDLLQGPTSSIYTRTVTNPTWGLRATLRDDAFSGTLFSVRDSGGGLVLIPAPYNTNVAAQPKSQATVSRLFWHSPQLSLNALAAVRDYRERGSNKVAGFGAEWQFTETQRLRAQWLHSDTSALPDDTGELSKQNAVDGNDLFLDYLVRTETDDSTVTYLRTGSGFRNDVGFVAQSGHQALAAVYGHTWRSKWGWDEVRAYVNSNVSRELSSARTINSSVAPGVYLNGRNGVELTFEPHLIEGARTAADGALNRPRFMHAEAAISPSSWLPRLSAKMDVGRLVDYDTGMVRPGRIIGFDARVRIGKYIEVEPRAQQTVLNSDSGTAFSETTWRLLSVVHLDAHSAVRLILQSHFNSRVFDPSANLDRFSERDNANSLTLIHRRSSSSIFYLGYVDQKTVNAFSRNRPKELFAKLQFEL